MRTVNEAGMQEVITTSKFTKLSPRPLSQYSSPKELRFSGKNAVVRRLENGCWQAYKHLGRSNEEVHHFDTWEEAIRWALEDL